MKFNHLYIFIVAVLLSCSDTRSKKLDTTTSGEITIVADETLYPLVDAEEYAFEGIYNRAKINSRYFPETDAINFMLRDSARIVIATRELNDNEKLLLQKDKIEPRITKIAEDAIVLIVHKAISDTMINLVQLKKLLTGEIKSWKDISTNGSTTPLKLIFDNKNSSTVSYLKTLIAPGDFNKERIYALKSNQEVIDYVQKDKNAIGVIGVNWISDSDDSTAVKFLSQVRVMNVASIAGAAEDEYYKPYQGYIAQKKYPLCRSVYVISREARAGLGTGFTAFIASDRGQRVVMKMGLLPATVPVRLVQIKEGDPFSN